MTTTEIIGWLEEVKDPEIPVLSLVDLGVIRSVEINGNDVSVVMTPTFVGCPALDLMRSEVETVLLRHGIPNPMVTISMEKPWSSNDISEKGRAALKKFGISPPPSSQVFTDLAILEHASCPRCNGTNTQLKNTFGPALCRAVYYCVDCREAFEQFKPL